MRDYKHSKVEKEQGHAILDRIKSAYVEYLKPVPGELPRDRSGEAIYKVDDKKLSGIIKTLKKDMDIDTILLHVDYPGLLEVLKDDPELLALAEAFGDIMNMDRLREDAKRRSDAVKKRVKEIYG